MIFSLIILLYYCKQCSSNYGNLSATGIVEPKFLTLNLHNNGYMWRTTVEIEVNQSLAGTVVMATFYNSLHSFVVPGTVEPPDSSGRVLLHASFPCMKDDLLYDIYLFASKVGTNQFLAFHVPSCKTKSTGCQTVDNLRYGYWVLSPDTQFIDGTLHSKLSRTVKSDKFPTFKYNCDFYSNAFSLYSEEYMRSLLRNRSLLFIGDSTLEEIFMSLMELYSHGSWTISNSSTKNSTTIKTLQYHQLKRVYDSGSNFGDVCFRFLWSGGFNPSQDCIGHHVFTNEPWLIQLNEMLAIPSHMDVAKTQRTVFINSGLHDIFGCSASLNITAYEDSVHNIVLYLLNFGVTVVWVSTVPDYKPFSFTTRNMEINLLNKKAEQVVISLKLQRTFYNRLFYLDRTALRVGFANDGDGVHCISKYYEYEKWLGNDEKFTPSCTAQAYLIAHAISLIEH